MQLYDISQPIFDCVVFPGDTAPSRKSVLKIAEGDNCNLTDFTMCAHNGTHVDAPYHFYNDGKTIGEVMLSKFIGQAYVAEWEGDLDGKGAEDILSRAGKAFAGADKKILIKGPATVTEDAARVFARVGIDLLGNESQTVGPEDAPRNVHLILLEKEIVLLEGIRLGMVSEGAYMLNCAPINLGDCDGAPCRAVLMQLD